MDAEEGEEAEGVVGLVVADPRWEPLDLRALAERAARAVLDETGGDPEGVTLDLLAADDAEIAALNGRFRGKAAPTNVLSWPAEDDGFPGERRFLGSVALAWETCAAEAEEAGIPLADHAAHLVVHGVMHLLGHDHEEDAEAERMEALEAKILAMLGVANPYGR